MKQPLRVDNSMLSSFKLCPMRYFWNYELRLSLKSDYNKFKPEFGSAWHAAMEAWYKTSSIASATEAFSKYWQNFDGQDPSEIRTMQRGLIGIVKYTNLFPIEHEPFSLPAILDGIEIGGMVEIEDFLYGFKIDGLVKSKQSPECIILEHKTSVHSGFFIGKPNAQIEGYAYCAELISGYPVAGALINKIKFRKGRKGEPIEKTIDMSREQVLISETDKKHWLSDVKYWANRIIECQVNKSWPKNSNACTTYGRCPYLVLCEQRLLTYNLTPNDPLFVKETWEPYPGAFQETTE